jgi:hypothetical protein
MSPILGIVASSKLKVSGAYESIATITGSGTPSTITFSSIPSTYKHLQVRFRALANTTGTDPYLRFNGVSTLTYDWHSIQGNGSNVYPFASPGDEGIRIMYGADGGTTYPMSGIIDIHDYASTTKNKTLRSLAGQDMNNTFGGPVVLTSGLWRNTSAITSLSLILFGGPVFTTASVFSLYGIKG